MSSMKILIDGWISKWHECAECEHMITDEHIKTDVPEVLCNDCYNESPEEHDKIYNIGV